MVLLKTQDYTYDLPGPGQYGDDLSVRAELCRQIEIEKEWCLQWRQLFDERQHRRIVLWSRESLTRRLFRGRRMQTHRIATTMLYVLPARAGIHQFGLTIGGTLYRERTLRLPDGSKQRYWLKLDDVYGSRLSNGVLSGYLLWSLKDRDGHVDLPQGTL